MSAEPGGRYQLRTRIATGGMGEVWRSEDTLLDREVAVKVLKHEYADDPVFRARFEAEARHAAALHHPNVASVFDVGEIVEDDGSGTRRPFLVMELVPGQPLSDLLRGGEPMPPERAADYVAQASDAIAAAHAIGVIHRDVKPANLLVTPDGTVKITDFGIARAGDAATITQTGQVIGTPHYISPEQAEGHPATTASDVYALGVVLYECLAGARPFPRHTPIQVAIAHIREPVPPLDERVPARLRAIAEKALSKRPEDRFGSAADLAVALRGGALPGFAGITGPALGAAAASPVADGVADGVADAVADPGADPVVDPVATQVLSDVAPASATAPPFSADRRRRITLPVWWPWAVAAATVLAVVLATSALAGGGDATPVAAADASGPENAGNGTAGGAEESDDGVRVREGTLLGRDAKEVRRELELKGLRVRETDTSATTADQQEGTVAAVQPTGLLDPGTRVTLAVFDRYVAPAPVARDDDHDSDDDDDDRDSDDDSKSKGKGKSQGKKGDD